MANIFNNTGVYYFQVPQHPIESGLWWRLKAVSQDLYMLLLFRAQKYSNGTVALTSGDIEDVTGMTDKSVITARTELKKKGLIEAVSMGKSGYEYTILNPINSESLEKVSDFNTLSRELLEAYFRHHVADYEPTVSLNAQSKHQLTFTCPFHPSDRRKKDQLLSVLLDAGGPWQCGGYAGCKRSGKLVDFEMDMAEKYGETITKTEAHGRVQKIVNRAANVLAKAKADAEAEELEEERLIVAQGF